jgi:hypothetical protein
MHLPTGRDEEQELIQRLTALTYRESPPLRTGGHAVREIANPSPRAPGEDEVRFLKRLGASRVACKPAKRRVR